MIDSEEEAARWFAASRRGVMLHDERADYEQWLRDPGNAARLAELQAIWVALDGNAVAAPTHEAEVVASFSHTTHRAQIAAMAAFVSVTAGVFTRIDGVWWNSLDWWSR